MNFMFQNNYFQHYNFGENFLTARCGVTSYKNSLTRRFLAIAEAADALPFVIGTHIGLQINDTQLALLVA